ncbi:MAG: ribonuclease Z [Pyrinomonadaceae bacterium]
MQITFLGTSAGVPTRTRNVSAVALRLEQRGEVWLFDCGEGTQHQFLRTDLRTSQISRIFITHMHGDHVYGLMGLLATCGLSGQAQPIEVYGPSTLPEYVAACSRLSRADFSERVMASAVQEGVVYEDEEFIVSCRPLRHRVPSFGYRVTEKDRTGRFDAERAAALGIPFGPLYGKLKRGESVMLADGRHVNGAQLCAPPEKGRAFVYCTDTVYCDSSVALALGADVLIHESTFADEDVELARVSTHSTATTAARVAREAGVGRLVLTHLSPRYMPGNPVGPEELLRQAREVFPETILAHDFLRLDLPRHRGEGVSGAVD